MQNTANQTMQAINVIPFADFKLSEGGTMCFTGRRPKDLCGYDQKSYSTFVNWLADLLYSCYYQGYGVRNFITGGAQGFDQLAFWAVEHMKRRYRLTDVTNIVFGVKDQETRWKKTGAFSQEEYHKMLRMADIVVWVSGGSIKALFERNHFMCDFGDHVLALYPDDTWHTNKGGTSECLRYAVNHRDSIQTIYRIPYSLDCGVLTAQSPVDCGPGLFSA